MSLVNDYLKRLGHKSMAQPPGKGSEIVPPALLRIQEGSGKTAAGKKYLIFAGLVAAVYGLGYLLVSVLTISVFPSVEESVAVEADQAHVAQITEDVAEIQPLPKQIEENVTSESGPPPEAVNVPGLPETNNPPVANEIIIAQNTTIAATQHPQPVRVIEPEKHTSGLAGTVEQPYPIGETGQGTNAQVSPKRIIFKESQNTPVYFYQIALQAQHNNNFGRAERYYRMVLKEEPSHENALVNLAAIYIQEKRLQEAKSLLNKVIELNPENPKALVNTGMVELQQKNRNIAVDYFLQALRYNPIEETALINLAYLAQQEKRYDEAGDYFEKLVQISPGKTNVLLAYAGLEEKRQNYTSSINLYRRCLSQLSMQKHPEQYARIKQRIQILRQYAAQQTRKPYEF